MYEPYPGITPPPPDAVLWRYMPFKRFESLLENSALWFTRVDQFGDEHEGSITQKALDTYRSRFADEAAMERFLKNLKHSRFLTLANCWHWNANENISMWDRYGKDDGVAVRTTFDRLAKSFTCPGPIHIGRVEYIDYKVEEFSSYSVFFSYLHKRLEFKDEHEVRVLSYLLSSGPLRWVKITPELSPLCEIGEYRAIDIHTLISEIVVYPNAPEEYLNRVKTTCERFGVLAHVRRSSLDDPPIWQ